MSKREKMNDTEVVHRYYHRWDYSGTIMRLLGKSLYGKYSACMISSVVSGPIYLWMFELDCSRATLLAL